MRRDMTKVLVERPRGGCKLEPKGRFRTRYRVDPESAPKREGICRNKTKSLSENLSPLKSFLRRRVGCSWDAVYSEISKQLRPSNAVQQHVRDHLDDFVVRRTWIDDGVLMGAGRYGRPAPINRQYGSFYVCPNSGRLCELVYRWRRRKNGEWGQRGCTCETCCG